MAGRALPRAGASARRSDAPCSQAPRRAQFRILRQKGTEPAGTGEYDKHKATGVYECAGCGTPLYKSTTKFSSGCGWPAFFDGERVAVACYVRG